MPSRWCLTCGTLFDRDATGTWRCPHCQPTVDAARRARSAAGRGSSTARGYGSVYRRRRDAIVVRAVNAALAGTPQACVICLRPCLEGQPLTAHHLDRKPHLADQATARLGLAHAGCNSGYRHAG